MRVPQKLVVVPCHGYPPETLITFATVTHQFGSPGDLQVTGDWDGNGRESIGVFHNGVFQVTNDFFETNGSSTFGFIGDLPLTGDWTGIGRRRLGLFHPSTGHVAGDETGRGSRHQLHVRRCCRSPRSGALDWGPVRETRGSGGVAPPLLMPYQTSLPTAGPQSVSSWRLDGRMLARSSSRV